MNRIINCPNCNKGLLEQHSFCPNCGFDLRQNQNPPDTISQSMTKPKNKSIIGMLGSPLGSVFVCLIVGTIAMHIINGDHKYLGDSNNDTASIIAEIIGRGAGFLIIAAAPSLVFSLILFAIKKKFPKDAFVTMLYVFTGIVAWYVLSILYK